MLELRGVRAGYGRIEALRAVALHVGAGEIVTLIGANGAGKSTTLMTVCGVVALQGGEVLFEGESLAGLAPNAIVARGIVQVPEGRRIFPRMTVLENLQMGAALDDLAHALVIPRVCPHLVVSTQATTTVFDCQLMVVALPHPYHFAILQSALHGRWARARGSTFKGDLRYTNTTIFETFPFPLLPDGTYDPRKVPASEEARRATACAQQFERIRSNACRNQNLGLTKLHNALVDPIDDELGRAYVALNEAVCELYGFPPSTWRDQDATLGRLLDLNRKVATMAERER